MSSEIIELLLIYEFIRSQLVIYNAIRGQWMSKMLKGDQSSKIQKMQLKTHFCINNHMAPASIVGSLEVNRCKKKW